MISKQIKLWRLAEGNFAVNTEAEPAEMYNLMSWLIDDNIRLLGVLIYGSLSKGTLSGATEQTNLHGEVVVGKSAAFENNSVIAALNRFLWGDDVTIGGSSHIRNVGVPSFEEVIWFPEGHGIDLEEGDHLYVNMHLHPIGWAPGAGAGCMCTGVIFYYVER